MAVFMIMSRRQRRCRPVILRLITTAPSCLEIALSIDLASGSRRCSFRHGCRPAWDPGFSAATPNSTTRRSSEHSGLPSRSMTQATNNSRNAIMPHQTGIRNCWQTLRTINLKLPAVTVPKPRRPIPQPGRSRRQRAPRRKLARHVANRCRYRLVHRRTAAGAAAYHLGFRGEDEACSKWSCRSPATPLRRSS